MYKVRLGLNHTSYHKPADFNHPYSQVSWLQPPLFTSQLTSTTPAFRPGVQQVPFLGCCGFTNTFAHKNVDLQTHLLTKCGFTNTFAHKMWIYKHLCSQKCGFTNTFAHKPWNYKHLCSQDVDLQAPVLTRQSSVLYLFTGHGVHDPCSKCRVLNILAYRQTWLPISVPSHGFRITSTWLGFETVLLTVQVPNIAARRAGAGELSLTAKGRINRPEFD